MQEGDILVGLTGYVGEVGRIPQHKSAMLNQRVAKFIPNSIHEKYTYYNFLYCTVRQEKFKEYAKTNAKGSAQANISTNELLNYSVIKATDNLHIAFEQYVSPLLEKILKNSGENEFLIEVRDLLLPKLLSGEIEL
ncbi:restriction endonuclease subunit S [Pasteurellaceae bacterium 22721_9_1]